jgi:peroxiredoxin
LTGRGVFPKLPVPNHATSSRNPHGDQRRRQASRRNHARDEGRPPTAVTTDDLFGGKKVVVFAVPGAYTPTCSQAHLPGFVVNADAIKAKGVDSIVCLSVNDAFVMDSWGKEANAEQLVMVGDGNGEFTNKLGLEMDGSGFGLGTRSSVTP